VTSRYAAFSSGLQEANSGGSDPQWSRDGHELFYLSGDQLMAVPITPGADAIEPGLPKPLFRVSVESANRRNHYLVADNGKRFLVVQTVGRDAPVRLVAIVNWMFH